MSKDCLKMYVARYCTTYHHNHSKSTIDYRKYIAATSFTAAIGIAQEILWDEFAKAPSLTPTDTHYQIEYEVTKALVPPTEGIASTTIWAILRAGNKPQWTTTLEMVAPQPHEKIYLSATKTHLFPLQYTPGERVEDEERTLFLAIMRGEKPWIEPEEPQDCVQHNLLEVN